MFLQCLQENRGPRNRQLSKCRGSIYPQPGAQPENHPQEGGGEHRLSSCQLEYMLLGPLIGTQGDSHTLVPATFGDGRETVGFHQVLQVFQQLWGMSREPLRAPERL